MTSPNIISQTLPVAVDAMGGDHGAAVVVEGVIRAARDLSIKSIIVGDDAEIRSALSRSRFAWQDFIQIHHTTQVITMDDIPSKAIRIKTDASIRVAFELVARGKACAVVSPGNTGAMMTTGVFISGTLPGIARPAIASLIPKIGEAPPTVLLDSGANVDCHAYQLVQFALMGDFYAKIAIGIASPRVALLSNGTEHSKGTDIVRSAAQILSGISDINFVGFVEGRDIPGSNVDVVVCDGFVGNIVLKAMEGTVELVVDSMRHYINKSTRGRLGMWLAKPLLRKIFKENLDPSAYGGAPLLGLNHVAIVCHGSANVRAIMNAIRVAKKLSDGALSEKLRTTLDLLDQRESGAYENGVWSRVGQRFDRKRRAPERPTGVEENGSSQVNEKSETDEEKL